MPIKLKTIPPPVITKEDNHITDLFPKLEGKQIKIFNGKDVFWASAEVMGFTGKILHLKDVVFFNQNKKYTYDIEAKYITRIEVLN